jgi:DNA-binding Xre family transcriptional regulator
MDETRQLVDALKRCLKMRGLTYGTLAKRINLSEASVKRIFSERSFTLRRLEQVCGALEISLGELIRMVEQGGSRPTKLSVEQEEALARDPALLSYFYLLMNGATDAEIQRGYEFDAPRIQKVRARLIELELIEPLTRGRQRLRVGRQISWRIDGPVRRAYERQVKAEFLQADFTDHGDFFSWQPAELTAASIEILKRKLALLQREFLDLAELDSTSTQTRYSTALLLAFRPWVFSLVAVRRRKGSAMPSGSGRGGSATRQDEGHGSIT